jgi:hypothetical protein
MPAVYGYSKLGQVWLILPGYISGESVPEILMKSIRLNVLRVMGCTIVTASSLKMIILNCYDSKRNSDICHFQ